MVRNICWVFDVHVLNEGEIGKGFKGYRLKILEASVIRVKILQVAKSKEKLILVGGRDSALIVERL